MVGQAADRAHPGRCFLFFESQQVPADTLLECDVCIVGGGPAGITIAQEFANSRHNVILLESGGIQFDRAIQELYSGQNIGRKYSDPKDTDLRLRFFGGATNHWGGWCAMPYPLDFQVREDIQYSGWPFPLSHLSPWYTRAQQVCRIGPYGFDPSEWGMNLSDIPAPFTGPHFGCEIIRVSRPIVRFGPAYGPGLELAKNVRVFLNATGMDFEIGADAATVKTLKVGSLSGRRFSVRARIYVLAGGAIENARVLLWSRSQTKVGFGNDHDLVGRFFMPHLAYTGGIVVLLNQSIDPKFFHPNNLHIRDGRSLRYIRTFSLSENTRRERHLPSLRFALYPPDADTMEIIRKNSSTRQMKDLGEPLSARILVARINAEQLPNPASRVTLSQERDALGVQTVLIDWQLTAKDKDAMVAAHRLFGAELGRVGLGRYQSLVPQDEGSWPGDMVGNGHTMGTTRMHRDPRYGVVDENCRVHGIQNLYVAGSSVFPTAGSFNPTLTLVALALRLADHVKEAPI